ncbi:F-box domain-containing protein [Caenorhabditis elegans]|uniref:F-box domain-containing protein n=1 Tax=Caenorhabditis elegans TaxID=6239 RepID=Q9NF66_CAEEL|nr:F-box domain-containing protein [Caenorhabditis elegans]CAB54989.1 F-box domain-containing protein [Caenorhabditis elegans]|eukprot:NP_502878.1 Uncharacterized protein CELE_Y105C5A.10 [Caenorhabditis elegans]
MATVPFLILRLPESALQKSLKHMSLAEHLSLSFRVEQHSKTHHIVV